VTQEYLIKQNRESRRQQTTGNGIQTT